MKRRTAQHAWAMDGARGRIIIASPVPPCSLAAPLRSVLFLRCPFILSFVDAGVVSGVGGVGVADSRAQPPSRYSMEREE